jgi:3-oxoacyl-[acyl-carrier-protein] synthase II
MADGNMRTQSHITGIGSVSPCGTISGLIHQQQRALKTIKGWPTRGLRKAYLVEPFLPSAVVPGLKTRRLDRLSVWALVASALALQDAQVDPATIIQSRCSVVFGTGFGPTDLTGAFCGSVADNGCSRADAIVFPETLDNSAGCHVARHFGFKGPNITVTCRGVSGEAAIIQAATFLESGEADLVIAIGGDVLGQALYDYYERTGVLASACLDAGAVEGSEPRQRDGFVPGEGLAAFVMESGNRFQKRRGGAYGRYRSGFMGADLTALPFSWGHDRATITDLISRALKPARPEDVAAVVAAGNGSASLDALESESLREVFGHRDPIHVVAPKQQLGEFDGNAQLRLTMAFSRLHQDAQTGAASQGKLMLLLGASTGGGRAALTFELP